MQDRDNHKQGVYKAHKLGFAAVAAGLQPTDALMLNEDVLAFVAGCNLETELHLMYLVAPVAPNAMLSWPHLWKVISHAESTRPVVKTVVRLSQIDLKLACKLATKQAKGWKPEVRSASCLAMFC